MSGGYNETPRGWQADTGLRNRYANAAGTLKIAQKTNIAKVFASFAVAVDPATLAALGLVFGFVWGATQ
ncbi:hypothetical protein [Thalassobacter stenotrophicus]|uniref:hypothetical protein n=1 Tax=Thalassobacter stenotrophicus TaxID=266809 RepID=UPI000D5FCD0F|nr:hypothetical protein [Thalassobacter stenotrophicus]PVZ47920.1 hypothetical protein DD557_03660 [Thalassobacter stenotrophicus]